MRPTVLLKGLLVVLVAALTATLLSWATSQHQTARAQGGGAAQGGGGASGNWLMVASELRQGEGLVYLFNTDKEVLLIYAYHRGRKRGAARNDFDGDLQFLAGRHCKWDALYCQRLPFPTECPPKGSQTQKEIEKRYLNLIDGKDKAKKDG